MKLLYIAASIALCVVCPCIRAQNAVLLGADPAAAGPIRLAPGQVVTLWVTGLTTTARFGATATGTPFPTTLAGISVTMTQVNPPKLPPVPIISVSATFTGPCASVERCDVFGVTVQIPYELEPDDIPACGGCTNHGEIFISDGTNRTRSLVVSPVSSRVNVLG